MSLQRIAMLSVHTCPQAVLGGKKTGGMNVYVRDLSRELGQRGIQVDIYTRLQDSCEPHLHTLLGDNARVIHVPAGPQTSLDPDQIYPYLPEFTDSVLRYVAEHSLRYDVIYSHYWLSGVVAHKLRDEWHAPVVQLFHTLGLMKDRVARAPSDKPINLRAFSEMDIMSWADRLIALTPAERAQMLWLYRANRRRIEVVSPGVDLTRFHRLSPELARQAIGLPADQRMLLFVGRIEPLKGVDTIFEAMALIKQQAPHLLNKLCLSIIGGNPDDPAGDNAEMDRLKALRSRLDLSELVMFLGAKDQDTLTNYYAAAEALIMPSDYESFGMVALEAMASGTPVIASEVGGLAFLVQDGINGFHIPVREPAALAARIRVVLEQPTTRQQLAENAIRHAQDYGWPKIADRLLEIFAELIALQHPALT